MRSSEMKRPARLMRTGRDATRLRLCPRLENDLQGVLDLPEPIFTDVLGFSEIGARRRGSRKDLGCAGQWHCSAACIPKYRVVEVDRGVVYYVVCDVLWMVKEIEELHAELHLNAFRDFEILVDPGVHISGWRTGANAHSGVTNRPQLEAGDAEHIGIEVRPGIRATRAARLTRNTIRALFIGSGAISYARRIAESLYGNQRRNRGPAR